MKSVFWCKGKDHGGFPRGWVYFAGLHFKLFCYMSEDKSPSQHGDTTSTFSGTTGSKPLLLCQGCEGLGAGSCPEGSVHSENELGPCSALG